jgi:DNA-binding XRE family transcriptional regulator
VIVSRWPGNRVVIGAGCPRFTTIGAVTRAELELIAATRAGLADGSAKERRKRARITQTEMAARCGVGQSSVSGWESGGKVPRTEHALAYGRTLPAAERKAA